MSAKSSEPRTLRDLRPGEEGVVEEITLHGPTGQRLMALGLLPGCALRFLRAAPLGDPLMVETPGGVVCLRMAEAALVALRP